MESGYLIEFYSPRWPENLISALKEPYSGVKILYSEKSQKISPQVQRQLSSVISDIFGFKPEFIPVSQCSIPCIFEKLASIVQGGGHYDIDITGGDEAFICAAGYLAAASKNPNIRIHQYDIATGKIKTEFPKSEKEQGYGLFPRYISAPQILSLSGAMPQASVRYPFSDPVLRKEILRLWDAVKTIPKEWNRFLSFPPSDPSEPHSHLKGRRFDENEQNLRAYRAVMQRLSQSGILTEKHSVSKNGKLTTEWEWLVPKHLRFLYDKAGNALEMYCGLAAFDADLFHDIRIGMVLDWDGNVSPKPFPDPKNEIDLVVMRENLPILASCKNTFPQNEYLYEIMTMSRHFGGFYATPMLLTSQRATPALRRRAKEMEILLIDGIRYLSVSELSERFRKFFL